MLSCTKASWGTFLRCPIRPLAQCPPVLGKGLLRSTNSRDMILRMLRSLAPLLFAILPFPLGAQSKASNPLPTYKIAIAQKHSDMGTYFEVARDGALLFFVGDKAGNWDLRRVSGWDTSSPKVERLKLKGPSREEIDGARFGQSTFVLTNDGQFALTRVERDAPGMASSFRRNSQAVINVINLQSYSVVSTLNTADQLLAGGFWQTFEEHSILAEYGANEKDASGNTFSRNSVGLLEVPTMHASIECNYLLHYGEIKQDGHGGSSRTTSNSDLSSGCAEIMHKTNASEPEDIQKFQTVSSAVRELKFQPPEFSGGSPAWHGCSLVEERAEDKLALFGCGNGHQTWYDSSKMDSRAYFAVDVTTGTPLLRVSVNPSKSAIGHLITHDGKPWLALLTDHVDLAFYPIQ
jgi:hypothetical protein